MRTLYFDCFSGISGDMTIGALLDLGIDGVDKDTFLNELSKINVDGFKVEFSRAEKLGIGAQDVDVVLTNGEMKDAGCANGLEHHHDHDNHDHEEHDHDHHHDHEGHSHEHHHAHVHRNINDVTTIIDNSTISDGAKDLAKRIFMRVAKAESKVHGKPLEEVHFHEVGALDSIVDIIGTAILIDMIKPDRICSSVVNDGYGFILCQHGHMPVPVPATAEIYADSNIKYRQVDVKNEMVTPTGAAIIAELSDSFGMCPAMNVVKTGYGAGKRDFAIPNVLRVILGETEE
jgi:uncharacterized protein (TIGR00299 family) protein